MDFTFAIGNNFNTFLDAYRSYGTNGFDMLVVSVGKSQVTSGFVASNHGYLVITKLRGYLAT